MYCYPFYNDYEILDYASGDVNGDGFLECVYLVGKKYSPNSPFRQDITLIIYDYIKNKYTNVPLKENAGYNPNLFLGDFTGDKIDNIFISISSGGSGGFSYDYLYSFINDKAKLIFDFEKFNDEYKYEVNYRDNYKVEVISKKLNTKYILDITYKGDEYLSEIYTEDGTLKEPIEGMVVSVGNIYPIDFQNDNVLELYVFQRIIGRYGADGLGYVQTSLAWEKDEFSPFFQNVAIFGS